MDFLIGLIGIPLLIWASWRFAKRLWIVNESWFRVFFDTRLSVIKKEAARMRKILEFPRRY